MDDAYIGRLFETIVLHLNADFHQLLPQILMHALEMTSERLIEVYGIAYGNLVKAICEKDGWCDKIQAYFESGSVRREP